MSNNTPIISATLSEDELRQRLADMPIDDLRDVLAGSPNGVWRMQGKIERQRDALDAMNRRQASLRFALKVHEQAHGPLTAEEWAAARDALAVANPAHADRVDEKVPTAA